MLHILDLSGQHIKSFTAHTASVSDISMDVTGDFIATASIDGQVAVHSLSGSETPSFNLKRPLRTVALEPNFAKSSTRSVISGGMAGNLTLHEKGWLGYKETVLHSGEGPIWQVRWRDNLVAWANELGVKIYDTQSQSRITFIDRPADSPRADLFKCTLHWQDNSTLLIGWADQIKVARIRARPRKTSAASSGPPLLVEITAVFQLDCMMSGIVPHLLSHSSPGSAALIESAVKKTNGTGSVRSTAPKPPALTAFLVLAYTPPDMSLLTGNEATADRAEQARKQAERPELRIISRAGEELAADALSITNFERWNCNDYVLVDIEAGPVKASASGSAGERYYVVLSPKDLVVVKPRDWRDHVAWLVERKRYEEALEEIERQSDEADAAGEKDSIDAVQIGQRYVEHLVGEGDFVKAARLCPKVCGQDTKRWEDWIFVFAQKHQLQAIIPYIPTESPTLGPLVYEIVLTYFLAHDRQALLQTIKTWPKGIYDISAVIVAVQSELDRAPSSSTTKPTGPGTVILMECLAELFTLNRQPGKALPYFLRLRRPNVFQLIRENNLFTDVQDQALLLVEFDQELREKRRQEGEEVDTDPVAAITLLVDHIHSIPIGRVVQQLQSRPAYLYLYLDALFHKDPHLTSAYADTQVKLYAEYAPRRLIDFLRASNYYNLEEAYNVCNERDLVPEMVFLLGRMGNNKKALNLIIERLGDVNRAIDFAKEQHDDDLWEDLLRYSETRPPFIRGLLENVGAEIDPIRLIRRIKNGLEIPGLKGALIKILHDFNLQVSLLEGCQTILNGDCADLVFKLHRNQTSGFFLSAKTPCPICSLPISQPAHGLALLFLCRHVVHAHCVDHGEELPQQPDPTLVGLGIGGQPGLSGKIAFTAILRAKITQGCPVCHKRSEGDRT
ncbi:vacuolar protein sorting-associated protein 41 [Trametes versicolor FP-101664 SS1]|uniref:Vacuolar protein sorting-associated protein 41 n=1 Tax=Trametes versicolor (strain FP-101664) TaxID=717944 RepID=R7SA02_TRAVS|nr:vacuolar protein sorting-associated protein 41 [Trametes versicolor FP-101664 SS1]EIW51779.1 vacuolar protein sorting-associated protein 41 [Trametes versicolor FP-101664 SS1]